MLELSFTEIQEAAPGEQLDGDQEFIFGHVTFKLPIRHPSTDG